eukprot:403343138
MQQLLGSNLIKLEPIDQSPGLNPSAFAQGNSPYKKVYIDVVDLLSKTSIIGLYFAAYWSGPCIGWGSLLQSFKNEMNQETNNFLEIVIIPMCGSPSAMMAQERGAQNSSHLHHNLKNEDLSKDEKEMLDFQHLCGCLMMPFEEQHNIQALKEKFQVQEIPTFVVLDRYGQEVSRDGIYDIKKYTKQQLITKWSENFKKDQLQQF